MQKEENKVFKSIFPKIITNEDFESKSEYNDKNNIVVNRFYDFLSIVYNIIGDNRVVLIDERFLLENKMSPEELHNLAKSNLLRQTNGQLKIHNVNASIGVDPFHMITIDSKFDVSLILLDEIWYGLSEMLGAKTLGVGFPVVDKLLVSSYEKFNSFISMKMFIEKAFDLAKADNVELSRNILIWKNGGWTNYKNEGGQTLDLFDFS